MPTFGSYPKKAVGEVRLSEKAVQVAERKEQELILDGIHYSKLKKQKPPLTETQNNCSWLRKWSGVCAALYTRRILEGKWSDKINLFHLLNVIDMQAICDISIDYCLWVLLKKYRLIKSTNSYPYEYLYHLKNKDIIMLVNALYLYLKQHKFNVINLYLLISIKYNCLRESSYSFWK